jgi:hypothetical protein
MVAAVLPTGESDPITEGEGFLLHTGSVLIDTHAATRSE